MWTVEGRWMLIVGVDILGWRSLIWRPTRSWGCLKGMANAEPRAALSDAPTTYPVGLFSITMAGYVFALRSTSQRALLLKSRNLASLASVCARSIFALS